MANLKDRLKKAAEDAKNEGGNSSETSAESTQNNQAHNENKPSSNSDKQKSKDKKAKEKALKNITSGLPDAGEAWVYSFLCSPRVKIGMTIPQKAKDAIMQKAVTDHKEKGNGLTFLNAKGEVEWTKFIWHALKEYGVDLPKHELLDARKIIRK